MLSNLAKKSSHGESKKISINYTAIAKSPKFKELLAAKRNFIIPFTIFFMIFYYILPIMTSYSKVLNTPAVGPISWAWVFAFAQFIMTWSLCHVYTAKAAKFDKQTEEILKEANLGGNN